MPAANVVSQSKQLMEPAEEYEVQQKQLPALDRSDEQEDADDIIMYKDDLPHKVEEYEDQADYSQIEY